jgi:hypothetical protein
VAGSGEWTFDFPFSLMWKLFREEPQKCFSNKKLFPGTKGDPGLLLAGTTEEVKHALNYAHGNRCRGFECHDITGSSRQRRTHLSPSLR